MDCRQAEELMVAYARGELAQTEAAELEKHLRTCPACRWNADAARKTLDVLKQAAEPDIVALTSEIIGAAIAEGASDIHIEPRQQDASIRLRVDGVLRDIRTIPKSVYLALVARIHVMGDMDPFELRVPQQSRIHIRRDDRDYHIRVTGLPAYWGPRLTLRILPPSFQGESGLAEIGFSPPNLAALRELLRRPCGLIVLSGPIGAGAKTTAYACLQEVNREGISVFSVEDAVDVVLPGVTQVSLNRKMGLDYPAALRAVMRSDPDVVLVGELPDEPTAVAAADLALTGHLVLATLHAPDAAGAVRRLMDLGLQSHVLAGSLLATLSQRLVRRVCPECREEYDLPADEIAFLHQCGIEDVPKRLWRGAGCDYCRRTGYRGRTAIHEILVIDDALVAALADGSYAAGMGLRAIRRTIARDGAERALEGVTTVWEARRVTSGSPRRTVPA